jgi:tetratricopeptide (TPR) repeat protein/predicted Ser/Thr protein kinase
MASMLEVLREYKHLAARKKAEGQLPDQLEARLAELEGLVKSQAGQTKAPIPKEDSKVGLPTAVRGTTPSPPRGSGPRPPARANSVTPRGSSLPRGNSMASAPARVAQPRGATPTPDGGTSTGDLKLDSVPRPAATTSLLPADPQRRAMVLGSLSALLLVCAPLAALTAGVPPDGIFDTLLPGILMFGGIAWALIYPGLMAIRERSAAKGSAHLNEPDFEARVPNVEPLVMTLAILGAVLWLMVGGVANQGLERLVGYLGGLLLGTVALGIGASLVVRPIAWKSAKKRAYRQYLEGGVYNLNKGNAKRARRLFERALDEAANRDQQVVAADRLKLAAVKEAEELRAKGRKDQADELLRTVRKRRGMETVTGWSGAASTATLDLPEDLDPDLLADAPPVVNEDDVKSPVLLTPEQITIRPTGYREVEADPDTEVQKERARTLIKKNRNREALQILVELGLPVDAIVAKAAAEEYITAGYLRSADAIYAALGERQIPEFYKAVAVEWVKNEGGNPPPQPVLRLLKVLIELGERTAAARLACQAALSKKGNKEERQAVGQHALDLCRALREEPPPEVLEAMEEYVSAGMAYEQQDRKEDALRVYRIVGERMLGDPAQRDKLLPILSKIFLLEKTPEDKFLEPLVRHVLESNVGGPNAIRILTAFRARHKTDVPVVQRLFQIYVQTGKLDEALAEMGQLAALPGSTAETVLADYQRLRERFPDEASVRLGLARAQIRAGKTRDALKELNFLLGSRLRAENPQDVLQLVDSILEWGKADIELRKERARLKLDTGDREAALADYEQYAKEGGRDPEAIQLATNLLSEDLVTQTGAPSYDAHLRLASFYLCAGEPAQAVPLLEVMRASSAHKARADLLLGRAELAASNPRRALQVFHESIEGRHPTETPELHYELARAYESIGDLKKSGKIDAALEHFIPGFSRKYAGERPTFGRSDTDWLKGDDVEAAGPETDPNAVPPGEDQTGYDAGLEVPEAPKAKGPPPVTVAPPVNGQPRPLKEVLLPRYQLGRCIGTGGMGEVHLAEDVALGREVAIKVLRRTLATDLFIAKFKDEARIVAQLSHPGIVAVYDIGQQADWSYIVMEYVRGPNLATLISGTTPPSRRDIISIIAAVAEGMAYAHKRGVIHRDLKPANILVGADGTVKITDFGIARVLQGQTDGETAFSAAGMQVGTVNYMAPEQILGKNADPRTDIYLLGTTLYFSLSRQYPYIGEAVVVRKTSEDPTPISVYLPDVSKELEQVLMKSMARDPANRYANMPEMAQALRNLPEMRVASQAPAFH